MGDSGDGVVTLSHLTRETGRLPEITTGTAHRPGGSGRWGYLTEPGAAVLNRSLLTDPVAHHPRRACLAGIAAEAAGRFGGLGRLTARKPHETRAALAKKRGADTVMPRSARSSIG